MAAGVVITFAASQLRPVYNDGQELRTKVGLPLLGVVTLVKNDVVRRKEARSLKRFLAAVLALVLLFVVGMAVLYYRSGLGS